MDDLSPVKVDPQDVETIIEVTSAIHQGDPMRIVGLVIFCVLICAIIFLWRRLIAVQTGATQVANEWVTKATELEHRSFQTLQTYLDRQSGKN